jgi:hypothetical protein
MSIKAQCECGKRFKTADEHAGKRAVCPACKREFVFVANEPDTAVPAISNKEAPSHAERAKTPPALPEIDSNLRQTDRPPGVRMFIVASAVSLLTVFVTLVVLRLMGERPFVGSEVQKTDVATTSSSRPEASNEDESPESIILRITDEYEDPLHRKRCITVVLDHKLPLDELKVLAIRIKNRDPEECEIGFIDFSPAGWTEKQGRWALSQWEKTEPVRTEIFGLTVDQERVIRTLPLELPKGSTLVGIWLDDNAFGGSRTAIYRYDDGYYRDERFPDSKRSLIDKLVELQSSRGKVFQIEKSTDVYTILRNTELEVMDRDGKVVTIMKPINPQPPVREKK